MTMLELRGIVPPLVTPIDDDGHVDVGSLRRLVEYVLAGGVHGLFVLGSSGEAASLDAAERAAVVRTAVDAGRRRVPVLVGVTDTAPRRISESMRMASELEADAVVAATTYYYLSNQKESLRFFRSLARESSLPLVAYNIPSMVKATLEPATIVQMAREGVICALKDSSPDLSTAREMLVQARDIPKFAVLTGLEFVVDLAVAMGMHGAVPGLANVAPRTYVDVYDLTRQGRLDQARTLQEGLIRLYQVARLGRSGQSHFAAALSGYKAALKAQGIIATSRLHAPMDGLTEDEEHDVKAIMQQAGFSP
jgi:4-hydroxy-tetrahydrodipicolinate synthase